MTARLCAALDRLGARLLDMEQVVIRDRLLLGILASLGGDEAAARQALTAEAGGLGVAVEFEAMASRRPESARERQVVTVLGQPLRAGALAAVAAAIAGCGGNIERIDRLSRYPIMSFELRVSGAEGRRLRTALAEAAAAERVDVAVQRAGLSRRAKRLVCLDVDSTLVAGEVIELLAARAGCAEEVAQVTAAAMAGELDFEASLRRRVALLEGCPASALDEVRQELELTPGARTVVRTLKRLGFTTAIVSGGFTQVVDRLATDLGIDYAAANTLEVRDGRLTGGLVGRVIDRAAKADVLEEFAARAGVPLSQTIAIGDGANDLDMLNRAGLGVAFNAKPVVRAAADTAVSVPYLDAILFLLGITREEIEAADAEDGPGRRAEAAPRGSRMLPHQ